MNQQRVERQYFWIPASAGMTVYPQPSVTSLPSYPQFAAAGMMADVSAHPELVEGSSPGGSTGSP